MLYFRKTERSVIGLRLWAARITAASLGNHFLIKCIIYGSWIFVKCLFLRVI